MLSMAPCCQPSLNTTCMSITKRSVFGWLCKIPSLLGIKHFCDPRCVKLFWLFSHLCRRNPSFVIYISSTFRKYVAHPWNITPHVSLETPENHVHPSPFITLLSTCLVGGFNPLWKYEKENNNNLHTFWPYNFTFYSLFNKQTETDAFTTFCGHVSFYHKETKFMNCKIAGASNHLI